MSQEEEEFVYEVVERESGVEAKLEARNPKWVSKSVCPNCGSKKILDADGYLLICSECGEMINPDEVEEEVKKDG